MRPFPRKSLLALAGVVVLTGGECSGPSEPKHDPIEGAVAGRYFQRLFNGKLANELPSLSEQPVVQYQGTLCLFAGGNYSYVRRFWLYNSQVNGGVDHDVVYGAYTGDPATSPIFSGSVSGGATFKGDTLNVGSDQYVRLDPASDCDGQR